MLWLLSFDDDKNTLADAVDKYCIGVPPIQWLAWIPQLLTCLVGSEGKLLLNLISQVELSKPGPHGVYGCRSLRDEDLTFVRLFVF